MLSDKRIAQFQKLYNDRFGKEIGVEEAHEKGTALIRFLRIIDKPLNEAEFREIEARQRLS